MGEGLLNRNIYDPQLSDVTKMSHPSTDEDFPTAAWKDYLLLFTWHPLYTLTPPEPEYSLGRITYS